MKNLVGFLGYEKTRFAFEIYRPLAKKKKLSLSFYYNIGIEKKVLPWLTAKKYNPNANFALKRQQYLMFIYCTCTSISNLLLITNSSWIFTIYKDRIFIKNNLENNSKMGLRIYKPRPIMAHVRYLLTFTDSFARIKSFLNFDSDVCWISSPLLTLILSNVEQ